MSHSKQAGTPADQSHTDLYRAMSGEGSIAELIGGALWYTQSVTGSSAYLYIASQGLPPGHLKVIAAGTMERPGFAGEFEGDTGRPRLDHLPLLQSGLRQGLRLGPQAYATPLCELPANDPMAGYVRGYQSAIEVPIFDRGEVFGHLVLLREGTEPATERQVEFAVHATDVYIRSIVSHRLREALARTSMLLERELQTVATIQKQLLPPIPADSPHSSFAARYVPCTRASGDFYSMRRNGPHTFTMVIADVAGHGAGAAVVVAMLRAWFGVFRLGWRPIELVAVDINQLWSEIGSLCTFATAIFLEVDERTGGVRCINCGHPPALVIAADGSVRELNHDSSLPLGVMPEITTPVVSDSIQPGDTLLLYTDGITEATNLAGEQLGVRALCGILRSAMALSNVGACADALTRALSEFQTGVTPADDQCFVLARLIALSPERGAEL